MTEGLLHGFEHGMFVRTVTAGRDERRTVVWLHGLGESGLCFERLVRDDALRGLRHVVPDLPGYGRSPWPARAPDLTEVADHVAGWLAARGGPAPVVVGHSMGGVVGVLLAERHPHAVRALVDVEGNVSPGDCVFSGRAAAWSGARKRGPSRWPNRPERRSNTARSGLRADPMPGRSSAPRRPDTGEDS